MAAADPLDNNEVNQIFDYLSNCKHGKLYAAIFALGLTTGARIAEISTIKRKDLINDNGKLTESFNIIKNKTGKKEQFRTVFIIKEFSGYIYEWLKRQQQKGFNHGDDLVCSIQENTPIHRNTFNKKLKNAVKFALISKRVSSHSMRKTHAEKLFYHYCKTNPGDQMQPLILLQYALGHSSVKVTENYIKFIQPQYQYNDVNTAFSK